MRKKRIEEERKKGRKEERKKERKEERKKGRKKKKERSDISCPTSKSTTLLNQLNIPPKIISVSMNEARLVAVWTSQWQPAISSGFSDKSRQASLSMIILHLDLSLPNTLAMLHQSLNLPHHLPFTALNANLVSVESSQLQTLLNPPLYLFLSSSKFQVCTFFATLFSFFILLLSASFSFFLFTFVKTCLPSLVPLVCIVLSMTKPRSSTTPQVTAPQHQLKGVFNFLRRPLRGTQKTTMLFTCWPLAILSLTGRQKLSHCGKNQLAW